MNCRSTFLFRVVPCAAFVFLCCSSYARTPFVPTNDAVVLERLPGGALDRSRAELRGLRRDWELDPTDATRATVLARRLIAKSRETSDPRYLGQAEGVLGQWWNRNDVPLGVLVLRATIRQSRHEFAPALADLDTVIARDPRHVQALLTRATVLQVTGDYAEARQASAALKQLTTELIALTCEAGIRSVTGEAPAAYESLSAALRRSQSSATEKLWAMTLLAEVAGRLGRAAAAEEHFKSALALGERDAYLLGAYADFLLDQRQLARVVELLKDETQADGLLLRLAFAETALRSPQAGRHVDLLKSRFEASALRGDSVHDREAARLHLHLLKKPAKALTFAKRNFETQREPADVRILLEAALAARDRASVTRAADFVRTNKLEDIQIEKLLQSATQP